MTASFTHRSVSLRKKPKRIIKEDTQRTGYKFLPPHFPAIVTEWIDRASTATGIYITTLERQQLIDALYSRRHLILSGPQDSGKRLLARELALSIMQGQTDKVRIIQGHPWWATATGDIARFVDLQMEFSVWRLVDFISIGRNASPHSSETEANAYVASYVACIERMSPVEVDFYFGVFLEWLQKNNRRGTGMESLHLIGTYDAWEPPLLDERILHTAAVVHLGEFPPAP